MELDLFHLSCFLLGKGKKSMFASSIFDKTRPKQPGNYFNPLWYIETGEPMGSYYKERGTFQRNYVLSKILVNPSPQSRTINIEGSYFTLEGSPVEHVILKPFSGTILLKQAAE